MNNWDPLSTVASADTVDNVVIFIADSLRFDYLPERLHSIGVTARTISPSTFTASSVPSLLTGNYPSKHQVWTFEGSLSSSPTLLDRSQSPSFDFDDAFHLQEYVLCNPPRRSLEDLDSPYVYVYHDRGGHLPYNRSFEDYDDMRTFFNEFSDPTELRAMYEKSVEASAQRFEDLIAVLKTRGELESTLVIFTSDHGEILGEYGGLFTHAVPMVPELVSVPTIFAGGGIPCGQHSETLLSGTDIAPTALSALGESVPSNLDGADLWSAQPSKRKPRSEVWKQTKFKYLTSYAAGSVWDSQGGHVIHKKSAFQRGIYASGVHLVKGPHAPLARTISPNRLSKMFSTHLSNPITYGTPTFSSEAAANQIPDFIKSESDTDIEIDHEHLKSLGYLE